MNCPGCGKDISRSTEYVDMSIDGRGGLWCLPCAKKQFATEELKKARKYAKQCENRTKDPLLVLATKIQLDGYECPNCAMFLSKSPRDKINLSITTGGHVCGLCGFFVPDLPDLIFAPDGNLWPEAGKTG